MRLVREVRCLIASPSDVVDDREAARRSISMWNAHEGQQFGVRVEPVMWETHSIPEAGQHPQASINRQLVDECDMCIALFWSKLGSATPGYASGTVEELERTVERRLPALVYFCTRGLPSNTDPDQLKAVRTYRAKIQDSVKWGEYGTAENLASLVGHHLTTAVAPRFKDAELATPKREVLTAPYPDINVTVSVFHIYPRTPGDPKQLIRLTARNLSPIKFFPSTVAARSALDGRSWICPRDAITGRSPTDFIIEPGNSLDFFINGDQVLKTQQERPNFPDAMLQTSFTLYDKAGREYKPEREDEEAMWRQLMKE